MSKKKKMPVEDKEESIWQILKEVLEERIGVYKKLLPYIGYVFGCLFLFYGICGAIAHSGHPSSELDYSIIFIGIGGPIAYFCFRLTRKTINNNADKKQMRRKRR